MVKIFIDGASRGNPGISSIAAVIFRNNKEIRRIGCYIGKNTNNFAEYMALIFGLIEAIKIGDKEVEVFSDSTLIVNQIKGRFKIKNPHLQGLNILCKYIIENFEKFSITTISREKNKLADKIANEVLNNIK
jgi:ribonuclease HI